MTRQDQQGAGGGGSPHRQDEGVDGRTLHHVDAPAHRRHLGEVLVPLGQVLHHPLHHLVTGVADRNQQLRKLLHVLRHTHTHRIIPLFLLLIHEFT